MFESEAGGEKEAGLDLIIPHYGEKQLYNSGYFSEK